MDYYGYITTMRWRAIAALEKRERPCGAHSIERGETGQKSPEHFARNPFGQTPIVVAHHTEDGSQIPSSQLDHRVFTLWSPIPEPKLVLEQRDR
jgi:glutathione S-transferase